MMGAMTELSDVELARAARAGDTGALGLLLRRHEAGMRAVALNILGYGPDHEDAVQDAMLIALRRISELRDPAAVGAWLRMIVRNACRMRLRAARAVVPVADPQLPADWSTPERILDDHGARDWIWHAIGQLPPPMRQVVLLRHFSDVTSYEQIAVACEVPVGTVRSRLSHARARLSEALLATADQAHADAGAMNAASTQEGIEVVAAFERGEFSDVIADRWSQDMHVALGSVHGGIELILNGMDEDFTDGVGGRCANAVASRDTTVWELDLISPPHDPDHCPPRVVWLMTHADGWVTRLRLFHPVP